jgi:uncharacterized membrane protein (DUF485 family)
MSKGLLFFCCSCCILLLTVINLSIGPIINRKVSSRSITVGGTYSTRGNSWGTYNCPFLSDVYDEYKKGTVNDEIKKYSYEFQINECKRKKAMHDMEYTSFIFDIVIGFVCGLLGLLHLFDLKKDFVSTTGLIGLGCGVVGFVLTFVYVIFNGIVYTNYYDNDQIYKRDGDGAFAELKGERYECFYFDENGNTHSLIAKYSDLNKKQYNYNKDLEDSYEKDEVGGCTSISPNLCSINDGFISGKIYIHNQISNGECKYLYLDESKLSQEVTDKDKSDRFLTTLILGLFVCLANIGLALFGFLLFRTPGDF